MKHEHMLTYELRTHTLQQHRKGEEEEKKSNQETRSLGMSRLCRREKTHTRTEKQMEQDTGWLQT